MDKKVKFVWKFYGLEAQGTADHHVVHLKEYCEKEKIECLESNSESIEGGGVQAFLTLNEKDAITAHSFLKPHGAFVVK